MPFSLRWLGVRVLLSRNINAYDDEIMVHIETNSNEHDEEERVVLF